MRWAQGQRCGEMQRRKQEGEQMQYRERRHARLHSTALDRVSQPTACDAAIPFQNEAGAGVRRRDVTEGCVMRVALTSCSHHQLLPLVQRDRGQPLYRSVTLKHSTTVLWFKCLQQHSFLLHRIGPSRLVTVTRHCTADAVEPLAKLFMTARAAAIRDERCKWWRHCCTAKERVLRVCHILCAC